MSTLKLLILLLCLVLSGCGGSSGNFSASAASGATAGPVVADSSEVSSTPSGTRLGFITQPTRAGEAFSLFQVGVYDEVGDLVPVDGIEIGLSSPDLPLEGDVSESTANGIATFAGVFTELAGAGTIVATSPGLQEARSARFVVGPNDPEGIRLDFQPADLDVGEAFNFSLVVTDRFGNPVPGIELTVELLEGALELPLSAMMRATSNAQGVVTFDGLSAAISRTAFLRFTGAGDPVNSSLFNIFPPGTLFETWRPVEPSILNLTRFTFSGSRYVAVGDFGVIVVTDDGVDFQFPFSGTNVRLTDVAYGAGLFVAVGEEGTILSSVDGVLWTPRDSTTTEDLSSVTFQTFDSGESFEVRSDNNTRFSSSNGVDWTSGGPGQVGPIGNTNDGPDWAGRVDELRSLSDVLFTGSEWVAVGEREIVYSADGENWTSVSGISSTFIDMTRGPNHLVAVGLSGEISTSTDGRTWTPVTPLTDRTLFGVAFGNSLYMAVGDDETVLVSGADTVSWSQVQFQNSNLQYRDVAFGAGIFVAVTSRSTILSSEDGVTWDTRLPSAGGRAFRQVDFHDGLFVAVGEGGLTATSSDGLTWVVNDLDSGFSIRGLGYINGTWLAVGRDNPRQNGLILTSTDAVNWTQQESNVTGILQAAAGTGDRAVVVGDNPRVLVSP